MWSICMGHKVALVGVIHRAGHKDHPHRIGSHIKVMLLFPMLSIGNVLESSDLAHP